jgi:hypothetical protein
LVRRAPERFTNAPLISSVLASMGGFAVGIHAATRIVASATNASGHEAEQPDAAWPQRTTLALGPWFSTSARSNLPSAV